MGLNYFASNSCFLFNRRSLNRSTVSGSVGCFHHLTSFSILFISFNSAFLPYQWFQFLFNLFSIFLSLFFFFISYPLSFFQSYFKLILLFFLFFHSQHLIIPIFSLTDTKQRLFFFPFWIFVISLSLQLLFCQACTLYLAAVILKL